MPEIEKTKLKKKKIKRFKMLKKKSAQPTEPEPSVDTEIEKKKESKIQEESLEGERALGKETKLEEEAQEEVGKKPEEKDVIRLNYKALNKVLRHGLRFSSPNIPREEWIECMGFLIGNVSDGKVEIKDAIPMVHGNLVEVEFQAEHYAKADEINQKLTDENWVVGWYHTHPGHGLFLSRVDKINHSGYQSLNSKAIALVFDPSKFGDGNKLKECIKIFRLKDPDLREDSDFTEVENVELQHPLRDVMDAFLEMSTLSSKEYPLILEYREDYRKPEVVPVTVLPEEADIMERDIKEMRELIKTMHEEVKLLHGQLERHMASTKKAIEEVRRETVAKEVSKPKHVTKCEFCGYDSIMPGDSICGNCGMRL